VDGFSIRAWDAPTAEVGSLDLAVPVMGFDPEGAIRCNLRWESQTKADDARFERAWYDDFRARWRADLKREHELYKARLDDAVNTLYTGGL
jgi:hypothetical protein